MQVVWIVVGIVAFDFVMFVALLSFFARLDGWHAVAQRYSTTVAPQGQRFKWCFASFRWVDYNGCLTMVVAPEGLYFAIARVFRLGHPCLLIPWSALHFVKIHKVWFAQQAVLDVEAPALTRIRIPLNVFEAAKPYMQGLPQEAPVP